MVIDSMFVYHFFDPDLRVEVIFRKERTAENSGYRHLCTLVLVHELIPFFDSSCGTKHMNFQ